MANILKGVPAAMILIIGLFLIPARAQNISKDKELAQEYMRRQEYNKAIEIFEKISRQPDQREFIYQDYLKCLEAAAKPTDAEKFIKKMAAQYNERLDYKIDLFAHYQTQKNSKQAAKMLEKIESQVIKNQTLLHTSAAYLVKKGLSAQALHLYGQARRVSANPNAYSFEMADLWVGSGQLPTMISEILDNLDKNPQELGQAKSIFIKHLTKEEDLLILENELLKRLQLQADNTAFSQLMLWVAVQQNNFLKAFVQARSLDLKQKREGVGVFELALIAIKNQDFDAAIQMLDYIVERYPESQKSFEAREQLMFCRQEQLKTKYPIDQYQVRLLLNEYKTLLGRAQGPVNQRNQASIYRSMATLYGQWLFEPDSAIVILEKIQNLTRVEKSIKARAKIDMADMYALKKEYWESALLYAQVEKDDEDSPLSYEAKLKNARLFYYKGEFDLAIEQLNILKLATTREISNDAMQLSLIIKDNLEQDTTGKALQMYAQADLLYFQKQYLQAIEKLDNLEKLYPNDQIKDEVYWLKSLVFRAIRQPDKSLELLEKLCASFPESLFADDALFWQGMIWQEEKKNPQKAMEKYQLLMETKASSFYVIEARQRYRMLRGDILK